MRFNVNFCIGIWVKQNVEKKTWESVMAKKKKSPLGFPLPKNKANNSWKLPLKGVGLGLDYWWLSGLQFDLSALGLDGGKLIKIAGNRG